MKKYLLLACLLPLAVGHAQVGIGSNAVSFDDSEILRIASQNKGVLLPNVSISDLTKAAPVTSPANSLMVYNTNGNTGKGFYYWLNNRWNPLLDTTNIYKYLGIVRSESAVSTSGVNDNTPITGVSYTMGEAPSAHQWQLIPGLSKTISLYSSENAVSVSGSGIAQVNSAATDDTFLSYSIALFVDSKLVGVRNFIINGKQKCLYNDFNVYFNISNLSTGNHLFELRETLRVRHQDSYSITFGGKHTSCGNLSPIMEKSIMNIQISEKP